MSVLQESRTDASVSLPVESKRKDPLLFRFLDLLCSVRLGVVLLILLGLACLIGMLIMQQNVDGFEAYYAQLTPAQRLVYGSLGFFDIYHVWYFNALLALLSLNIILASIDRFPKAWTYVAKPTLTVPVRWLREQRAADEFTAGGEKETLVKNISEAMTVAGWRKPIVSEKNGRTFVFAQSGTWNRLGAYAVHVALLTIFFGGFLTAQFGNTGQMPLTPGQTTSDIFDLVVNLDQVSQVTKRLPFQVTCTDVQQILIKNDGSLLASNTIDWITRIRIKDESGTTEAAVQMNRPFDYRGYRFFQASFVPTGRARNITIRLKSAADGTTQDLTIPRDGNSSLPDGTNIRFADFRGNFSMGKENPNEDTSDYPNPAAILQITPPNGAPETAYAFGPKLANIPIAKKPIAGYTFQLIDFEKVSDRHVLSVQRDPGATVVYVGFMMLSLTLFAVFFFSHRRVWAAIEKNADDKFAVVLGANANRNQNGLEEKFNNFARDLRERIQEK
jgi:cytochrome c biogenesis protein